MPWLQLTSGTQWGLYLYFSVVYGSQFSGLLVSSFKTDHELEKDNLCLNKNIIDSKHVAEKEKNQNQMQYK